MQYQFKSMVFWLWQCSMYSRFVGGSHFQNASEKLPMSDKYEMIAWMCMTRPREICYAQGSQITCLGFRWVGQEWGYFVKMRTTDWLDISRRFEKYVPPAKTNWIEEGF